MAKTAQHNFRCLSVLKDGPTGDGSLKSSTDYDTSDDDDDDDDDDEE